MLWLSHPSAGEGRRGSLSQREMYDLGRQKEGARGLFFLLLFLNSLQRKIILMPYFGHIWGSTLQSPSVLVITLINHRGDPLCKKNSLYPNTPTTELNFPFHHHGI